MCRSLRKSRRFSFYALGLGVYGFCVNYKLGILIPLVVAGFFTAPSPQLHGESMTLGQNLEQVLEANLRLQVS